MTKNKYAVENLPLSDITRSGLNNGIFIDILSALGVMMTLQDDSYEETNKEILKTLIHINEKIEKISKIVSNHERRIRCLEDKIDKLIA